MLTRVNSPRVLGFQKFDSIVINISHETWVTPFSELALIV